MARPKAERKTRLTEESPTRPEVRSAKRDEPTVRCGRPQLEEPASARGRPRTSVRGSPSAPRSGRYDDEGEIAKGGMGSVRRVFDRVVLRHVAVKKLHPGVAAMSGAKARFLEEAQITGQLDHPNVVPVYDVALGADGMPETFTMKLVRGKTLRTLTADALKQGDLSGDDLEKLLRVVLKVCEAVAFAHSRGVIHRDLKPDNVMVGTHGQVYLMDWGIALLRGSEPRSASGSTRGMRISCERSEWRGEAEGRAKNVITRAPRGALHGTDAAVGTPEYMAPEQARGETRKVDARSDVFALGGILYRILTGKPPFFKRNRKDALVLAREGVVLPPEQVARDRTLPPGLCRIAMRALEPRPGDRYASVEELALAIEDFLHGGGWFATRRVRAGIVIVQEGDRPDAAYLVQSGRCEVYRTSGDRHVRLSRVEPGEVFGEVAMLTGERRTASVVALEDSTLLVITPAALERELGRSSWLRAFVQGLTNRFVSANARLREQE